MTGLRHDSQLPVEDRRLKRATKALVGAVGGTADAGEVSRTRQQRVSEWTLPNVDCFIDVGSVRRLEEEARGSEGWPQVTRAMARHHGFELLPLPQSVAGDNSWHRTIAAVSRETGEVVGGLVQALADDDRVSAAEIRELKIMAEIDGAIACLAELKALCRAKLDEAAA